MSELTAAIDRLQDALDEVPGDTDSYGRLEEITGRLRSMVADDRTPDHGQIARIQMSLSEIRSDVESTASERVNDASEALKAFRATIDGV